MEIIMIKIIQKYSKGMLLLALLSCSVTKPVNPSIRLKDGLSFIALSYATHTFLLKYGLQDLIYHYLNSQKQREIGFNGWLVQFGITMINNGIGLFLAKKTYDKASDIHNKYKQLNSIESHKKQ